MKLGQYSYPFVANICLKWREMLMKDAKHRRRMEMSSQWSNRQPFKTFRKSWMSPLQEKSDDMFKKVTAVNWRRTQGVSWIWCNTLFIWLIFHSRWIYFFYLMFLRVYSFLYKLFTILYLYCQIITTIIIIKNKLINHEGNWLGKL